MSQFSAALRRAIATHDELVRSEKESHRSPRVVSVALPAPRKLRIGVAHRLAAHVPVSGRPVVVLRPVPDDAVTLREFVLAQFEPPARRLAR